MVKASYCSFIDLRDDVGGSNVLANGYNIAQRNCNPTSADCYVFISFVSSLPSITSCIGFAITSGTSISIG